MTTYARQAASVRQSVAEMRADRGPPIVHYAVPLDMPGLFRWVADSALADDGVTVIVPTGGGALGAWVRVREADRGADLTDANATLVVGGKRWRTLPAATLTANRTATLGTTNAAAGDTIGITRLDVGAFTYAIANGGAGGGTLATMPVSARAHLVAYFDGTNWSHRASGLLL